MRIDKINPLSLAVLSKFNSKSKMNFRSKFDLKLTKMSKNMFETFLTADNPDRSTHESKVLIKTFEPNISNQKFRVETFEEPRRSSRTVQVVN